MYLALISLLIFTPEVSMSGSRIFNGTTQYFQGFNHTEHSLPASGFAVGCRFWLNAYPPTNQEAVIIHKGDGVNNEYIIRVLTNGIIQAKVYHSSGSVSVLSTTPVQLATAYNVAINYDGSHVKLFVDGAEVGSTALSGGTQVTSGGLALGRFSILAQGYMSGGVSKVGIWSVSKESEMNGLYSGPGKLFVELSAQELVGLVDYYNGDEATAGDNLITSVATSTRNLVSQNVVGVGEEVTGGGGDPDPGKNNIATMLSNGETVKIVTFGTSLTQEGYWTNWFWRGISDDYPEQILISNRGRGSTNSGWGLTNVNRVIDESPDVVFIEFAFNDAHTGFNMSVAQSRANIEAIVNAIELALPSCQIVLMSMNPPTGDGLVARPNYLAYYNEWSTVAAERSLNYIDNHARWQAAASANIIDSILLQPGGEHPTEAAIKAIMFPGIYDDLGINHN